MDHGSITRTHTQSLQSHKTVNLHDIFYGVWRFEALMSVQSCWRNCPWASRTYRWRCQSLEDDLSGETSAARPTPTSEMAWQFVNQCLVVWNPKAKKQLQTLFDSGSYIWKKNSMNFHKIHQNWLRRLLSITFKANLKLTEYNEFMWFQRCRLSLPNLTPEMSLHILCA